MSKSVTIEQVMDWEPCYSASRVKKLFGKRKSLTALQIMRLPIPNADKLWAVLRSDFLDGKTLRLLACDFAEHVLHLYEVVYPEDKRPMKCIDVARRYAEGEATKAELADAITEAYHVAVTAIRMIEELSECSN